MLNNLLGKIAAPFIAIMGVIAALWYARSKGVEQGKAEEQKEISENNKESANDAKKRIESMRSVDDAGFIKRVRKSEQG